MGSHPEKMLIQYRTEDGGEIQMKIPANHSEGLNVLSDLAEQHPGCLLHGCRIPNLKTSSVTDKRYYSYGRLPL